MKRPILVTGGAGYIGSHICKAIHTNGDIPITYDNLSTGRKDFVKWGPLFRGDITQLDELDVAFKKYQPYAVVHMAALISVDESVRQPGRYEETNFRGSLNVLDSMKRHDCSRMIFSSTAAVFGEPQSIPVTEDHPCKPINPYGATKLKLEEVLQGQESIASCSFRYFNAAGADPDSEIGEPSEKSSHLIPIVLNVPLGAKDSMTVFGNDYPTPDGTCIRDYIHVSDLAQAHIIALDKLDGSFGAQRFNLGSGTGYSVLEVIKAVEEITGQKVNHEIGDRRPGDPARLVATSDRATKELGWKPQHSDLATIVETTWKWMKKEFK